MLSYELVVFTGIDDILLKFLCIKSPFSFAVETLIHLGVPTKTLKQVKVYCEMDKAGPLKVLASILFI